MLCESLLTTGDCKQGRETASHSSDLSIQCLAYGRLCAGCRGFQAAEEGPHPRKEARGGPEAAGHREGL